MEEMVARLRALCKAKGTSFPKLEASFGWGNGTIGKWKYAKNLPPIDKLQMLADALNVSVNYIVYGENENKPVPTEDEPLSLDYLRTLSTEQLLQIMKDATQALSEKK